MAFTAAFLPPSSVVRSIFPRASQHGSAVCARAAQSSPSSSSSSSVLNRLYATAPKGRPSPSSSKFKPTASPRPTPRPDPSQPLVLYTGPPQYRPVVSHFLLLVFSVVGITTGANVQKHAVWPLWPTKDGKEQKLMDEKVRMAMGVGVGVAGIMLGSLFKWAAAKNITRITLIEQAGKPLLNIKVASPPLFNRELITRGHPRVITEGRGSPEFTVPLSRVVRTTGSAVAAGWVDERTAGRDRRTITLQVGSNGSEAYVLETAGGLEPNREKSANVVAYWFRVFEWAVIRGRPEPPYFWSRQAFDELIPPAGPRRMR